jgi:hypothetical protein
MTVKRMDNVGIVVPRELEACATERSCTISSFEAESQICIRVPTRARNPWEQLGSCISAVFSSMTRPTDSR